MMILTAGFCFCLIVGNVKLFGKEFIGVSGTTATDTERNALNTDLFSIAATGPCLTTKGTLGRCISFRQCYPFFKQKESNTFDNWVLGMYDTCTYHTAQGRQMFGICCINTDDQTKPPKAPSENEDTDNIPEAQNNTIAKPYIPQIFQWPPPLPTHPPHHTIPPLPTHPASPGYPTIPPTAWPPTQKPINQKPTTPKPVYKPPTLYPINKPTTPKPVPTQPKPTPPKPAQDTPVFAGCGTKNGYQDQGKIVGGHEAEPNEWPWIAGLFNAGRQFCGGSLIDDTHILSAAHCVAHMTSFDVAKLTVRLGDHNIKSNTEVKHVEKRVKRVVRHRGFDSRTLYNDIAILTLDSPVAFSKTVRPICLPSSTATYAGKTGTVIGWGSLRENGQQPAVLQEVNIPIWTNTNCRQKYGAAAPGGIVDHMLCAGEAARDSCSGDSGGPLMVNDGKWTQVGIVSWGIGCGKGQYPGVYTRVEKFMPWIQKNLK